MTSRPRPPLPVSVKGPATAGDDRETERTSVVGTGQIDFAAFDPIWVGTGADRGGRFADQAFGAALPARGLRFGTLRHALDHAHQPGRRCDVDSAEGLFAVPSRERGAERTVGAGLVVGRPRLEARVVGRFGFGTDARGSARTGDDWERVGEVRDRPFRFRPRRQGARRRERAAGGRRDQRRAGATGEVQLEVFEGKLRIFAEACPQLTGRRPSLTPSSPPISTCPGSLTTTPVIGS